MNEKECEFAYILGQLIAILHNEDIINLMLKNEVSFSQITNASNVLKYIADKTFYGKK